MSETDHFEVGIATLSTSSIDDFASDSPYKINGVAIPVNTIVNGGQNVDHYFPAEVLDGAGELLEGVPIVKNFHELQGQASADDVIGQVTNAGFQKGVGLVFEGEITDTDIARKISQGYLDVSPTPARSLGAFDDSMNAQRVDRLVDFRDIAVVANGQPGAKVEAGGNSAIEALAHDALSRGFNFDTLQSEMSIHTPEFESTTTGEWESPSLEDFTSDSWDELPDEEKTSIGNHFIGSMSGFPAENYGDMFLPVVDANGNLSLSALRNAKARAGQVSGLSGDDLDMVISTINGLAEDNYPESEFDTQSDDPEGASSAAVDSNDTMSKNDLSDDEQAVLRAAEDVDNAVDVLGAYAAAEQPEIVEQDTLSKKDEQLDELASVFRDALSEKTGLKKETVECMSVDALANEFRDEEGEISTTTLSQTPETQTPASDESDDESPSFDSLSLSERDAVSNKVQKINLLEGRVGEDHLDALKSEAAELAQVDDYEDIEMEAL